MAEKVEDPRFEFFGDYITKSLKLKIEKWNKFISGEERHVLINFFDMPNKNMIVFRLTSAGVITCSFTFPPGNKGKMIYFLRNSDQKLTPENFRQEITIGEISGNVLHDLAILAEEVIGPMLTNPENQFGWPKIVVNDMQKHVDDLRNLFHQLKGEMNSQVMLPMPSGLEKVYMAESRLRESDGHDIDLNLKSDIEGAVIAWAQQVHDLLKEDSYIAFKLKKFPLPNSDLEFYAARLRNLEGIYSQLRDPRVKRMAHYLEVTKSVYLECFKTMLTNVVAAIVECRDINVHERPLAHVFETFEGMDFLESKYQIRPMFHCIGLLWGNSRYFCNVEKLIPLLREMCNLVIQQCTNSIDPTSIFQGEAEDAVVRIKKALYLLEYYIATYEMNREKVPSFFPPGVIPVRWSFNFDRVFQRYIAYLKRIKMIEKILEATCEILKLEKVEFNGLRGKVLSTECLEVLEDYMKNYQELGNITYDPADPEDDSFIEDYNKFMSMLNDVDRRLASLFAQGLDECENYEHFFKLFQIIGDLFHRPVINRELRPKLPKLLDLLHANLDAVKEIYDEEMSKISKGPERPMVDSFLPPTAGMIWWCNKLRRRIQHPMAEFLILDDPIVDSDYAVYLKHKQNEMMNHLNQLEEKLFKAWCLTVPGICVTNLAKHLIYRDPPFIRDNFNPELVVLLREIRYLKYLNKEGIPHEGENLYNRNEKLQADRTLLKRAIAWYNAIREGSHETEVALIEKEIDAIDNLLGRGVNNLTWNDDFTDWMGEVYQAINALQSRVLTAQSNVKAGLKHMENWGEIPLHNRKHNFDKVELLDILGRRTRVKARRELIIDSHAEFEQILKENYKLFFNVHDDDASDEEEETLDRVDESTLDDEEKAAYYKKLEEQEAQREQRRLEREQRKLEKAEKEEAKMARREARRLKREAAEAAHLERLERIDAGEEVPESPPPEAEEVLDPEELADIEEERREQEEEEFRNARWPAYVKYVDSLVSQKIMQAIKTSLDLFESQTNIETGPNIAFMKVIAELKDPDIEFSPSLDRRDDGSVYDTLKEMMKDVFFQATLFPRIDPAIVGKISYEDDISDRKDLIDLYHDLLERCEQAVSCILQYSQKYEKYFHLWMEDRQEALDLFLKYGRTIHPEEFDKYVFDNGREPPECQPTLEAFQVEINKYNAYYDEVAALPNKHLINGWLSLSLKRLNQSILNTICKWSNLFKEHLKDHVQNSLDGLEKFIKYATKELTVELQDDDYDGLLQVMKVLNEVREKQDAQTHEMFEPLRDIMFALREYDVIFPDETYEQLEALPEQWRNLVKLATVMKNTVAPLQAAQAQLISKRVALLNLRMTMYRDQFSDKDVFLLSSIDHYKAIDITNQEIMEFEKLIDGLNKSCALFDIQQPETKFVKQCRRELKLIKMLWDYHDLVVGTIESWKKSPWKKIDADGMDQECKRFSKDLRQLDKECRSWYASLRIASWMEPGHTQKHNLPNPYPAIASSKQLNY